MEKTVTGARSTKTVMLVGLTVVGLTMGLPRYAQAQSGVGVVTTLVGEATVARVAAPQPQALKKLDNVFPMDRITTRERSVIHVLMGGKALLTVRELSVVTITEEGGRSTVDLQSGKVGLAVVREKMTPGDVIEVHTPHAVAAVRGTVLVVEIVPGSAGTDQIRAGESSTNVHLLHGKLDVSLRSNPGAAPIQLESLQTVSVTRGALGTMRPISPAAAATITTDLKPRQQAVPAIPEKLQTAVGERHVLLAVAAAEGLARGDQGGGSGKGRGGKAGDEGKGKASNGDSNGDSIIPVGDTMDGSRVMIGNGSESNDGDGNGRGGGNSGGNSGGNGSGNGGGNGSGGRGIGLESGAGGGRGSSLGAAGGGASSGFAFVAPPRTFKKKQ
jgi:hypothetical protein